MIIAKTNDAREIGMLADVLKKFADTDEWAVARLAELRRNGEKATARVVWAPHALGTVFLVQVRRADGTIESAASLLHNLEQATTNAYTVDCPRCGANVGHLCQANGGVYHGTCVHEERFVAAQKGSSRT